MATKSYQILMDTLIEGRGAIEKSGAIGASVQSYVIVAPSRAKEIKFVYGLCPSRASLDFETDFRRT